eukprot:1417570-Pleurochrysis_carterae.AAC.1
MILIYKSRSQHETFTQPEPKSGSQPTSSSVLHHEFELHRKPHRHFSISTARPTRALGHLLAQVSLARARLDEAPSGTRRRAVRAWPLASRSAEGAAEARARTVTRAPRDARGDPLQRAHKVARRRHATGGTKPRTYMRISLSFFLSLSLSLSHSRPLSPSPSLSLFLFLSLFQS